MEGKGEGNPERVEYEGKTWGRAEERPTTPTGLRTYCFPQVPPVALKIQPLRG